jgi:abortive infection bacteriophage resistance protein
MEFTKPPKTFEEQVNLLIQRGMAIPDRAEAIHYLGHLNYYRLGAYWLPFEQDHTQHTFKPGTSFLDVLNLYVFDRELRLLVMDAIERIEVSIRTRWAFHLSHRYGAHAHLDSSLFKKRWHHKNVRKLQEDVRRSHETFIQHLRDKYNEELPPLWAVVEIMTFGQLSNWCSNLHHRPDRNAVAHVYDMDEINLNSFLHHLTVVRNICAHHGRLWNRDFTIIIKLPKQRPKALLSSLNPGSNRKLYNTLVLLGYLMDRISADHHWKARLSDVIHRHQPDIRAMGFPSEWERLQLWRRH